MVWPSWPQPWNLPRRLGAPRQVRLLVHRQGVHVGAQAHALAGSALALDDADDAGLADAGMNLDAVGFQLLGDQAGGAHFLEADLGVGMDVAADFRHAIRVTLDLLQDFHLRLHLIAGFDPCADGKVGRQGLSPQVSALTGAPGPPNTLAKSQDGPKSPHRKRHHERASEDDGAQCAVQADRFSRARDRRRTPRQWRDHPAPAHSARRIPALHSALSG